MSLALDIPILETKRLRLRELREADFSVECAFYDSAASVTVGGPKKPHEVWRTLAMMMGHWVMRGYGFWGVEEKDSGVYLGRVGLWYPNGWPEPEIGWTLMQNATGKGYATEAAIAARSFAYETLGWDTAVSLILPENEGSKAVARRLGAAQESVIDNPEWGEIEVWRHLSADQLAGLAQEACA